ncbi:MAG TPA: hypothetical protein VNO17_04300 [Actinomycetota bacterium]|nr:hypothetical protein [Actinomycetota bacterium]
MERKAVLVVTADRDARERIGAWLEAAAYEVLTCPGPTAPDYTCVAGRGGRCVLAEEADVVVLDPWLESDTVGEGTSSDELLTYYLDTERPVVVLSRVADRAPLDPSQDVVHVRWPPETERILEAVRMAARGPVSPPAGSGRDEA